MPKEGTAKPVRARRREKFCATPTETKRLKASWAAAVLGHEPPVEKATICASAGEGGSHSQASREADCARQTFCREGGRRIRSQEKGGRVRLRGNDWSAAASDRPGGENGDVSM